MASAEKEMTQMTNDTNKQIAADTNQANKDIAQMNNEFNLHMLDKQIAYNKAAYAQQVKDNKDFWQMNNDYNTPSAQMQRLSDAGLNPYMSQISPGTSSSAPSVSQMSGIDRPDASPYQAVGYSAIKPDVSAALQAALKVVDSVSNIGNSAMDNMVKVGQIRGTSLDNQLKVGTMGANIGSALAGLQGQSLQNDYQKIVNSFTPALMAGEANKLTLNNQAQWITNAMLDTNLQWLPLEKRLQAGSAAADIVTKIQQGRLTGEQIQTERRRAELLMYQGQGEKWNVDQKKRMQNYFDDAIKYGSIPSSYKSPAYVQYLLDKGSDAADKYKSSNDGSLLFPSDSALNANRKEYFDMRRKFSYFPK